jgi:calcineurin-like phosphoesterase family protein
VNVRYLRRFRDMTRVHGHDNGESPSQGEINAREERHGCKSAIKKKRRLLLWNQATRTHNSNDRSRVIHGRRHANDARKGRLSVQVHIESDPHQ